jgi:ABC-type sugar transport system permease subunit
MMNKRSLTPLFFLLPAWLWCFARFILPIVLGLPMSFYRIDVSVKGLKYNFVGLDNWYNIFQDYWFPLILQNTIYFMVVETFLVLTLGLIFALLLNQDVKGKKFFRTILILPWAVPGVTNGLVWQWIYNGDYGILNGILYHLGLLDHPIHWLTESSYAMNLCIISQTWKDVPFATLMILAALQSVPRELYESAYVDGASRFQAFKNIILPYIKLQVIFTLVVQMMYSFKVYDTIYMLTQGGPANATNVLYYYVYRVGFVSMNIGYGEVLALVVLIITIVFTLFYVRSIARAL